MKVNIGSLSIAVFLSALAGCGGEGADTQTGSGPNAWLEELQERPEYRDACDATPGCREAERPYAGPMEAIFRVQVVRDPSGAVSIGRVDTLSVSQDEGIPPGRATGDYLLAAVDGSGQVIDGQLIQFPRTLRLEYQDRTQAPTEIDLEGKRVDTVGYLRTDPATRRIEVRDQEGSVVASEMAPAAGGTGLAAGRGFGLISPAFAQSPGSGLPAHCAHVQILRGEVDRDLAGTLAFTEGTATLQRPGPFQLAAVKAALKRATPLLCGAIGRIAFAEVAPMENLAAGAVLQIGEGEIITLNTASYPESALAASKGNRLYLQTTLLHEAGHSVEALLNATGADPGLYGGDWGPTARSRAANALTDARLRKGFGEEWRRIHASFVSVGWARAHSISGLLVPEADSRVVDGGFMTSYGSNIWWDDIAEYLSEIYMAPVMRSEGFSSDDLACQAMQAWTQPSVPSDLAAAYTKVRFLEDLELVRPLDVKTCLGSSLGLQTQQKGLHFWLGGTHYRSFTKNLEAGIGTETVLRNRVFALSGEGEAGFQGELYPAKLTLRLDLRAIGDDIEQVSWPRGVYELGLTGDNNVELVLDGAKAGNFNAMDGFVLVAAASNSEIEGSIVLQRVFRMQAPIPVPERYDPPLIIRFRIAK